MLNFFYRRKRDHDSVAMLINSKDYVLYLVNVISGRAINFI